MKTENQIKKKLVSCIVPVLNEELTISNFIQSLNKQNYRPIELIIVDGGSKDKTIEIINKHIQELEDNSFSIKLLKEKDFGSTPSPANARNIGLDAVSGEFVLFIDSDTCFIETSTISSLIAEIGDNDFSVLLLKPLLDTKLEKFISKTINKGGILFYRREFVKKARFIPTLGFGEDKIFNYQLFGNFELSYKTNSKNYIGRHYPHTKKELSQQNKWYGRTIMRYIFTVYSINKRESIRQFTYVLYNILMAFFPLIILVSLLVSLKLSVILVATLFALILIRYFMYGLNSAEEYIFLLWYSIFCGFFFTKGLISNLYKKNIIGRV